MKVRCRVSVEERLVQYAQAVAHRFNELNQELLADLFTNGVEPADSDQNLVERGGGVAATQAASPARNADKDGAMSTESETNRKYTQRLHEAIQSYNKNGDDESALKIALILEGLSRFPEAREWWSIAAALGNADAIDYVEEYLSAPQHGAGPRHQPTAAMEVRARGSIFDDTSITQPTRSPGKKGGDSQ
jgi:TPR repeat protein